MNKLCIVTRNGEKFIQIYKLTGSFYGRHYPKATVLLEQKLPADADLDKIWEKARKEGLA